MRKTALATLLAFVLGSTGALAAEIADGEIMVSEKVSGTYLTFETKNWPKSAVGVSISIDGPKEYEALVGFGGGVPELDLAQYGEVIDGTYRYEIRGGTGEEIALKDPVNNGRDKELTKSEMITFALRGTLIIAGGRIVEFKQGTEKGSEEPGKPGEEDKGDGKEIEQPEGKDEPSKDGDENSK